MENNNQTDHDRITVMETKINGFLGFGKVVVTVCITATLAIVGALWDLGIWLYDNSGPLKAGIKAFLGAKGNGP